MATTAATPRRVRIGGRWRWVLLPLLAGIVALVTFAVVSPLALVWDAARLRLLFAGIHSGWTHIPFGADPRVRVHYYVGGEGDPVVLVHGLGGRADDWANLTPQLVHDHHRVYALDLPGYGRSEWPADAAYSITDESRAVEAFLDAMKLRRIDLCGWSMGGWLAMRVALDQPQRIRRLVILDSAGIRFSLNWDTALFVPKTPAQLRALNNLLMPTPPPAVPGFVARDIFSFEQKHGWVVRRNLDSMLTGVDLLDGKLGALKMPMLIVWGKQDYLIPLSVGEAIHKAVPQSELEIFDGCGHARGPVQGASGRW